MAPNGISCVLPRPDIAALSDELASELSTRLLGGAPVLPLSSEDVLAFVMAGTVNIMHGYVTQVEKENDPAQMCCDSLVIYAARHGFDLLGSTRAKGYVGITGIPGTAIPATLRFVGEASREYKLDPAVTFNPVTLDSTGYAVLRVVAAIGGTLFNLDAGAVLTVSTTVSGIDMAAVVVGNGIIGGTDDEDCDSLRRRVIAADAAGLIIDNEAWFLQQTLKYPGVTRACVDACQACCDPQTELIYPFMEGVYGKDYMTDPYGVPPCDVLDAMSLWMFGDEPGRGKGLARIGVRGSYQQAYPTRLNVNIECFQGCPTGAADRIKAALWPFIRQSYCVGSTICLDDLRAKINQSLGGGACIKSAGLSFDIGIRFQDQANAYLDCGRFLVLGDVSVNGNGQ